MDLDQYLTPEFDFSRLDMDDLRSMGNVALSELVSVVRNSKTTIDNTPGWSLSQYRYFAVGISHKARCLFILFSHKNGKICFTDVTFANEDDIKRFWC